MMKAQAAGSYQVRIDRLLRQVSRRGGWLLLLPWIPMLVAGCAGGCAGEGSGPPITKLNPDIEVPDGLSFGEINQLTTLTKELTISNVGAATLNIASATLAQGSSLSGNVNRFEIVREASPSLPAGSSTGVRITLNGWTEGLVTDTLIVESDDPDEEEQRIEIPIQGHVVRPVVEVFPASVVFDQTTTGNSSFESITIQNGGKGKLALYSLTFLNDTNQEFSYQLPPGFQLGQTLDAGNGIKVELRYSPFDDGTDSLNLEIATNDPQTPRMLIPVSGNGQQDYPPQVKIVSPGDGDAFYVGSTVTLLGQVSDSVDASDKLSIFWISSVEGQLCPNVKANEDGFVSCTAAFTQPGVQKITLSALDSAGQSASPDSITLQIWDLETPLSYTISGSDETSLYAFTPDDNMQVFVIDGLTGEQQSTPCVNAVDDSRDSEPPRTCDAKYGDSLRILIYDRYGTGYGVPKLHLWYGRQDEFDQVLVAEPIQKGRSDEDYVDVNPSCLPTPTRSEWYVDDPDREPPPDCLVYDATVEIVIPPPEPSTAE